MGVKLDPNKLHAIIIRTAAENHLPLNYDTFNAICKGYETGYAEWIFYRLRCL